MQVAGRAMHRHRQGLNPRVGVEGDRASGEIIGRGRGDPRCSARARRSRGSRRCRGRFAPGRNSSAERSVGLISRLLRRIVADPDDGREVNSSVPSGPDRGRCKTCESSPGSRTKVFARSAPSSEIGAPSPLACPFAPSPSAPLLTRTEDRRRAVGAAGEGAPRLERRRFLLLAGARRPIQRSWSPGNASASPGSGRRARGPRASACRRRSPDSRAASRPARATWSPSSRAV